MLLGEKHISKGAQNKSKNLKYRISNIFNVGKGKINQYYL